jgi:hypothetical protein
MVLPRGEVGGVGLADAVSVDVVAVADVDGDGLGWELLGQDIGCDVDADHVADERAVVVFGDGDGELVGDAFGHVPAELEMDAIEDDLSDVVADGVHGGLRGVRQWCVGRISAVVMDIHSQSIIG